MYWLIKTDLNQLEIWSDIQCSMMVRKCEYYGAKPFWQKIRELEVATIKNNFSADLGELVSYLELTAREKSS